MPTWQAGKSIKMNVIERQKVIGVLIINVNRRCMKKFYKKKFAHMVGSFKKSAYLCIAFDK